VLTSTINGRTWYWLTFLAFGIQGIFFATWVSRTPEIQKLLGLDTAQMAIFTFMLAIGSLSALVLVGPLIGLYGTRIVLIVSYTLGPVALTAIGFFAEAGNLVGASISLLFVGFAAGAGGLAVNIEGANVDRESPKSLLPSLHGAFSVGSLIGGALGTIAIVAGVDVFFNFLYVSLFLVVFTLAVTWNLPHDSGKHLQGHMDTAEIATIPSKAERRAVWKDRKVLTVAFIVIGFNLAEGTASTWLPIALVDAGLSPALATASYTVFAGAMAVGRLSGGPIVDKLGTSKSILLFGAITALGILIVILTNFIALPLIGAMLWGLGNSIGFPLCVSVVSQEKRLAGARVGALVIASNISGVTGPPLLGFIGQVFGLFTAFLVPFFLLLAGMTVNKATRTEKAVIARR
jgi:MFS family permease